MKRIISIIFGVVFLVSCNSDNAWDCFQNTGTLVAQEYDLEGFHSIIVWNRVKLYVAYGEPEQVIVETGENLMNEVLVRVEDSILKVSDRNSCNYTRDYGVTKVFVRVKREDLEIRNSSGLAVEGVGPIKFNNLSLVSEDRIQADEFHIDGDFIFNDLQVNNIDISANGVSKFYLKGRSLTAHIGLYDGDARVEGAELEVDNVYLFHRSTNKMIVNPQNLIQGTITGLGDVISVNRPPQVNVEELFTGQLIFE